MEEREIVDETEREEEICVKCKSCDKLSLHFYLFVEKLSFKKNCSTKAVQT